MDNLRNGSKQASIVLLDVTESDIKLEQILKDIDNSFRRRKQLKRVIVKSYNNILKVLDKKRN